MAVLMAMVYTVSLDLRPDDFRYVVRHPLAVGIGLIAQFVLLPGATLLLSFIALAAIFAPWVAPYDPYFTDLTKVMQPPNEQHWFGTDNTGRDILSRVIYGTRNTLMLGLVGVLIGGLFGGQLGILAAFYPGLEGWIMRLVDIMLAFPAILIGLAVAAIFLHGGWSKLAGLDSTAAYIAAKGLPAPELGALLAALLELGGGLAIALGLGTRWAALVLALFLVPTTWLFHNPMGLEAAAAQMQMIQVYKNLAIVGGLLALTAFGAGPLALEARADSLWRSHRESPAS